MNVDLGFDIKADVLFDAMKQSPVMKQKGYKLLYQKIYTAQQDGDDMYGLCYKDKGYDTFIHVRIDGHGTVSSFEYYTTLDVNKTADSDMKELTQELKQKFQGTTP